MEISIIEFCEIYGIIWEPINLEVTINDKIFKKCICQDKYEYMPDPTDFTKNILSKEELVKRQSYIDEFEYIAIDTKDYYQIDVDDANSIEKVKDLMNICPYFLSSKKKLPHIIYKSKVKYDNKRIGTKYKYEDNGKIKCGIEILSGQWSFVNKNEIIRNGNMNIPELELDFVEIEKKKEEKKKIKKIIEKDNEIIDMEKYKLIEKISICYKIKRIDEYDYWIKLLFAYKNELGDEGYSIFDNLSIKSNNYDKINNKTIWDKTERRSDGKRKTIKHLMEWALEDNEKKYYELIDKDDNILECEKDIAEYIIKKFLCNNYICADIKQNQYYYFNGLRWQEDINNTKLYNIITNDLVVDLMKKIKNTEEENKKRILNKIIKKLKGKISYFNSILDHIKMIIYNHEFLKIIDEDPDLIGFNDCVYDLSKKEKRMGKPEDYITKSVGYNYPNEYSEYKNEILDFFKKVFPNEDVRKYVLRQHAQSLSGRKGKDLIYTNTGIGSNGKSMTIELIKYTFGQYYENIPIKMLTAQNNSSHNTPDPFLSTLKGIRFASSNEPSDGAKINDSFIKNIGSQEEQKYRLLFSNVVSTLIFQLKLHIFCNDKLKLKGDDGGIKRRMVVINYGSKFEEVSNEKNHIYKVDYSLKNKIKLWRSDYMKILLDLYDINYEYSCPKEILEASNQYMEDNNDILKFIKENIIITNNETDYLLLKDLKEQYKNNKEYDQTRLHNFKESLEKNLNIIIHERKKINGKDCRSVLIGCKLYNDNELETELNELDK